MAAEIPDFDRLHPRYAAVRDYLGRVAPAGKLPGRQHLDPAALGPAILPFVNLAEVVRHEGALRFRFRLVGTRQTDAAAREITGRFIEEAVLPDYVGRINRNMQRVVQSREPLYDAFPMPHPGRDFIRSERVYFPLAADGKTVDMILIVNGYPRFE